MKRYIRLCFPALLLAACIEDEPVDIFPNRKPDAAEENPGAGNPPVTGNEGGDNQGQGDAGGMAGQLLPDGGAANPLDDLLTCSPSEFEAFTSCLSTTCSPGGELDAACAFTTCTKFIENLATPGCIECVSAAIAMDTALLAEKCVQPGALGDAGLSF